MCLLVRGLSQLWSPGSALPGSLVPVMRIVYIADVCNPLRLKTLDSQQPHLMEQDLMHLLWDPREASSIRTLYLTHTGFNLPDLYANCLYLPACYLKAITKNSKNSYFVVLYPSETLFINKWCTTQLCLKRASLTI